MKVFLLISGLLGALMVVEMTLRVGFGFGHPPLYIGDDRIGYLLAPNQKVRRFGNRIEINEYSMRAEAIAVKLPTTLRLFLLGDSLANGGWWTDQKDVLSYRIAHYLQPNLPAPYQMIEALNASANSWGPRNELAYLDRYGLFDSTILLLLLNTDDLFGTPPTPLQVGRDRSYPAQKPFSAISEVLSRYLQKNQPIPGLKDIQNEGGDRVGKNLTAIDGIRQKAMDNGSQFILVLSPLKREIPGPRDYELVARQRLKDWATDADVPYLDLLKTYQTHLPHADELYRDHIHLSPLGNELVGEAIADVILTLQQNSK
ncbi:MAG: lipolytic protein G-D-S-L family [Leptolyngbya foveolarum]|uniref:Lipolytic protein G-D-S-L family n=1 Tax=Leptolyngbya foveolarum TaxID=47253 RepID=A0A2W4UWF4_9CYAN|nr:MAG: lipolytic protein G-D-S-L family [Leptolyngbya foveolarum]